MKKFSSFYVVLFGCIFFMGCTRDQAYPTDDNPQQRIELTDEALSILGIYSDGDFEIPEDAAVEMAKAAISDLTLNPNTRTTTDAPIIKNVRPLVSDNFSPSFQYPSGTGPTLVVQLPKVLGYAVNFVNASQVNAGFVIVSADKRIGHTILATVPAGCLPISAEEEIENDGVAFFLDNAEEYAVWRIAEAERQVDSLKNALIAEYQPQYPDKTIEVVFEDTETRAINYPTTTSRISLSVTTTVEKDWWDVSCIEPLVPVEWDQEEPFNEQVKNKRKCGRVVTGCVPTAASQLMAY